MINTRIKIRRPKVCKISQRRGLCSQSIVPPAPPTTPATPANRKVIFTMDQSNVSEGVMLEATIEAGTISSVTPAAAAGLLAGHDGARHESLLGMRLPQTVPVGDAATREITTGHRASFGTGSFSHSHEDGPGYAATSRSNSTSSGIVSADGRITGGRVRHSLLLPGTTSPKKKWRDMPPLPPSPSSRRTTAPSRRTSALGADHTKTAVKAKPQPTPPQPPPAGGLVVEKKVTVSSMEDSNHANTHTAAMQLIAESAKQVSPSSSPGKMVDMASSPTHDAAKSAKAATESPIVVPSGAATAEATATSVGLDTKCLFTPIPDCTLRVTSRAGVDDGPRVLGYSPAKNSCDSIDLLNVVAPLECGSEAINKDGSAESMSPPHPPPRLMKRYGWSLNDCTMSSWIQKNSASASSNKTESAALPAELSIRINMESSPGVVGSNGENSEQSANAFVTATQVARFGVDRDFTTNRVGGFAKGREYKNVIRGSQMLGPRSDGGDKFEADIAGNRERLTSNRACRSLDPRRERSMAAVVAEVDAAHVVEFSRESCPMFSSETNAYSR